MPDTNKRTIVEAIVCSSEDAQLAEAAEAGRLEVCSAIELGGLTPSIGMLRAIRKATALPLMAMLRPRQGGFAYSPGEFSAMEHDVEALLETGAGGFVFGILTEDGRVDQSRCSSLVSRINGKEAVFHRAFDATPDPFETLEILIDLGFHRILTSGQAETALAGCDLLRRLVERANGRIEVMAGGGVRAENVFEIVRRTGVRAVHVGAMIKREDCSLGCAERERGRYGSDYPITDHASLARTISALSAMNK
jgi:copper homeostasis protein